MDVAPEGAAEEQDKGEEDKGKNVQDNEGYDDIGI